MQGNGFRSSRFSRDERHGKLVEVMCGRCGASVLAAKFSPQHTSVQWSAEGVRMCAEFGALGKPSALVEGCASLRDSIDVAVMDGRLEVSPP
jgi:hypothetical protein